jgi:HEPN domain-containing protein
MSSPDPVVTEALRWLRYCNDDLDAASRLMTGTPTSPRHACWLSQQAAEKALKAALILDEVDFPFIHDLDRLRNLLPTGWAVHDTHSDLAELTEWAVESRYPGGWPEPTDDDASRARSQARSVHESIVAEFRRRGIRVE